MTVPTDRPGGGPAGRDPPGTDPAGSGPVCRVTGMIVPGVSIAVNLVPVQPSGVSGHHSSGCDCGAATAQIP